jgi:molybdate transport system substrate-binding protein
MTLLFLTTGPGRCAAFLAAASVAYLTALGAQAGEVKVAVAANFTDAAKEIGALFATASGHKAIYSFGSTGQLYTQISQAAPFEVFLSADHARPKKAVDEGLAVKGSLFTYATGRIVLFSKDKGMVTEEATLKSGTFAKIAIANPATAPYGAAAVQTMKALGVYDALSARIVQGNNIAQTYQFVDTGNAEVGFIALSQIALHDKGSRWVVPESLYATIAQDAVLLKRGADNPAALAFAAFLKSAEARRVKEKYGYGSGD